MNQTSANRLGGSGSRFQLDLQVGIGVAVALLVAPES